MATSVTATSEPFSPTTATVSQPSGTASAGATGSSQVYIQSADSSGPTGGASGSNGGTTTQTLSCGSCCGPPVYYLGAWFGTQYGPGLCSGAVDNTKPVELVATFNFYNYGGYSISDLCLPSSVSVDVIANDPARPAYIYLKTPSTSCSAVTPPTTRFSIKSWRQSPYDYISAHGNFSFIMQFTGCSCGTAFDLSFGSALFRQIPTTSCSPFSLTYTGGGVYQNTIQKGLFDVTFTL